ncbi:hypothetical protein DdX_04638 [Ditylenchus destructor]|uniref:Uncharacterized protein n=1 Tax=Ditylenchus destructor TaxID=166010 RepID=A0AAD4NC05_9BILA|nr:hypothetical protein DdX_04638 [Ditylenchus destructor]
MERIKLRQITSWIEFSSGAKSRVKPESNTSKSLNLIEIQNYVSGSSIAVVGEEEKNETTLIIDTLICVCAHISVAAARVFATSTRDHHDVSIFRLPACLPSPNCLVGLGRRKLLTTSRDDHSKKR